MAFLLSLGDVRMVRCYFCFLGFFCRREVLAPRGHGPTLGWEVANTEKFLGLETELLRRSRFWNVVMRQQGLPYLKGRILVCMWWGEIQFSNHWMGVCLLDGSFPEPRKMIQMMRLPNMMVSPTQVLDDKCF